MLLGERGGKKKEKSMTNNNLKSIICRLIPVAIALYLLAVEMMSSPRYAITGIVVFCFWMSVFEFVKEKKIPFAIVAVISLAASVVLSRAGIMMLGALVVASCCLWIGKFMVTYGKAFAVAAFACIFAVGTYLVSGHILCMDSFRRDVTNTVLQSLFTDRRYSLNLIVKIPIVYLILVSVLLFFFLKEDYRGRSSKLFTSMMFGIVVYIAVLGVLYVTRFAYDNIAQGEYLTGFENYVRIPAVLILCFWGGYVPARLNKKVEAK